MTELERIVDTTELVPEDLMQACIDEWSSGAEVTLRGQLRQARAAYVAREQGSGFFGEFMGKVRIEKSHAYGFAKAWERWGEEVENGDLSTRLESGLLSISHLIATDDPKMLDAAEDEGLSVRAMKARMREDEEPDNVEVVTSRVCPMCNGVGEIPND